jgi:hypothetical protein
LVLDKEPFLKFFAKEKRSMMDRARLRESGVLDKLAVMSDLSRLRRQKILESMELCLFERGEYICTQGADERFFYIILSGKVWVTCHCHIQFILYIHHHARLDRIKIHR